LDATSNLLVGTTNNYAVGATGYVMAKTGYVFAADNTGNAGNRNWLISPNGSGAGNLDFVDSATNTGWPNNAFRMSLTASGNLGLGVTPSAWSAATKAFQIGDSGVISGNVGSEGFALGSNWYVDSLGVIKYNFSGPTTRYTATNGFHAWYIAPSGTAGDAISFTQAMTLDASGNLSIGQTSSALQSGGTGITLYGASASELKFLNSTTGQSATDGTALVTSGSDFVINNREAGAVTFGTNNTERARITSGGDLLVGTTADGAGIGVASRLAVRVTNGYAAILRGQTVGNAIVTAWNSTTTGDGVFHEFGTETSYTARGTISYNRAGGLVAYNTTSDYRAKDISGPVTDSGALIDSTPVYMGKMHGATQERPMFIAHEVPAYAHTGEKDAVDADGNPVYQQMDASALIPVMWAEIQSLRSRVAALEAA